jgi:hypothetical protein
MLFAQSAANLAALAARLQALAAAKRFLIDSPFTP